MKDGYKVGNLEITFKAIDKASASFDTLKNNLEAVKSAIESFGGISQKSLDKFGKVMDAISAKFAPLLADIKGATKGIAAFNQVVQKVGVKGISQAAAEMERLKKETPTNITGTGGENVAVPSGKADEIINETETVIEIQQSLNEKLLKQQQILRDTRAEWRQAFKSGDTERAHELAQQIENTTSEISKLNQELAETDTQAKKTSKGGLSKLLKQIGRIALYRTIRRGLQIITQAFRSSIQEYAKVDDSINDMMTKLTSSTKIISLSFGTILLPIIQAITPIVQQIAQGFANMANAINKSMALSSKSATYTKIEANALKDYRDQLNKTSNALFDFDKFRALSNKQEDSSIFLSTEEVSALDEAESKYSHIAELITSISGFISQIGNTIMQIKDALSPITSIASKLLSTVFDTASELLSILNSSGMIKVIVYEILGYITVMGAAKFITWIASGAAKTAILGLVKSLGTLKGAFTSLSIAMFAVTAAVAILSNWDEFSAGAKKAITAISGIAFALLTLFTIILAVKAAALGGWAIAAAIGMGIAALAAGIVMARGLFDKDVYTYADGGLPDKGTMFIAGEAGAEMVYNMPNGQSGVANISQIAQANYQGTISALNTWWQSARNDIPQFKEVSGSGIYEINRTQQNRRGQTTVNIGR